MEEKDPQLPEPTKENPAEQLEVKLDKTAVDAPPIQKAKKKKGAKRDFSNLKEQLKKARKVFSGIKKAFKKLKSKKGAESAKSALGEQLLQAKTARRSAKAALKDARKKGN